MVALRGQVGPQPAATSFRHSGPGGRAAFSWLAVAHASVVSDLAHQSHRCGHSRAPLGGRPEAGRAAYRRLWKKAELAATKRSAAALLWYGVTRAHPDLNQGPADLQSAALTTELCTQVRCASEQSYYVDLHGCVQAVRTYACSRCLRRMHGASDFAMKGTPGFEPGTC